MSGYRIEGDKEVVKYFKGVQNKMDGKTRGDPLRQGVARALHHVQAEARRKTTGGNPLHVRTGRLRSSILVDTQRIGKTVKGSVGTDVVYAAIHEFGGMAGRNRKVKIPKRPFLAPSIKAKRKQIEMEINKALGHIYGK